MWSFVGKQRLKLITSFIEAKIQRIFLKRLKMKIDICKRTKYVFNLFFFIPRFLPINVQSRKRFYTKNGCLMKTSRVKEIVTVAWPLTTDILKFKRCLTVDYWYIKIQKMVVQITTLNLWDLIISKLLKQKCITSYVHVWDRLSIYVWDHRCRYVPKWKDQFDTKAYRVKLSSLHMVVYLMLNSFIIDIWIPLEMIIYLTTHAWTQKDSDQLL